MKKVILPWKANSVHQSPIKRSRVNAVLPPLQNKNQSQDSLVIASTPIEPVTAKNSAFLRTSFACKLSLCFEKSLYS